MILWHMHQPQYRDPATGQYLLPWTRLHALKDYWGMVRLLEEFPGVHATFNFVPLLAAQIEEYASGNFKEPWFDIAFAPAAALTPEQKREALERAFQVNENLLRRWTRFDELHSQFRSRGAETCIAHWSERDWRDLQVLSQLAWTDEDYLRRDPVVSALSAKGQNFTEEDKSALRTKQQELLNAVLPEYRRACERGQIEISTTPYYHPILPLLCDTDIASVANPKTPRPYPPFRYPEDAREQLARACALHERVFGRAPAGLWPSEGSVSDQALEIAIDLGFQWFGTDEGVLGRTQNIGFWRDAAGYPQNGPDLYTPWRLRRGEREITGFFRDHYLSDLIGFVYSRMDQRVAAEDLHRRIRAIGEREPADRVATVSLILDGENAWEYYPGNGRDFLREFYRRIEQDPDIRGMAATEAMNAAADRPTLQGIFPASWINANFDVWIGDAEDVRAWDLLRNAREAYANGADRAKRGAPVDGAQLARAYESVLAAEGSDWTWWFGPEHASANDPEFDVLFRKHLTEIYAALGEQPPDALARPIKRTPEHAKREAPLTFLDARVDGRESNYFEWLGAGYYAPERHSSAMHGRVFAFSNFFYGFGPHRFFLRLDPIAETVAAIEEFQLRITLWDSRETCVTLRIDHGKLEGCVLEQGGACILHPESFVQVAYGKIIEVGLARELFDLHGCRELLLTVALWEAGLPVDVLPAEGVLNIGLGEENFAWAAEVPSPLAT
jgi:alpha-amylase/alpha-mannosidase (GH57 family)